MGGNQVRSISRIDEKNWVPILPNREVRFHNVNNYAYRALRNIQTNEEIEQYHVEFMSESDYMQYVKELTLRKEPSDMGIQAEPSTDSYYYLSPFIYTVKYFLNVSMVDLCSTSYKGYLYARKVDIRLKQINDIPLSDQLYMIRATLQGFKVLYEKMGYFDIVEEMIFIDKAGKVRVWVNPNLSHNEPHLIRSGNTREMHGSQAQMIVTLLNLIEDNTDQLYEEQIHFREYLINKGIFERLSFHLALEELDVYCMERKLQIDDHMPSIEELYYPETIVDEESERIIRDQVVERNGHGSSTIPTLNNNRSNMEGNVVNSPVRREYYPQEGLKSRMSESQTDKRSNYSTDNIYRSTHDPNQQSSRKVIVIPNSYRQTTPQFGYPPNQPVQTVRGGSGVRQPVTINFPPKPVKKAHHQEQISFKINPRVNHHTIINSERANDSMPVERISSVEKRANNTLFKFNYSTNISSNNLNHLSSNASTTLLRNYSSKPPGPSSSPSPAVNIQSAGIAQIKFSPQPPQHQAQFPQNNQPQAKIQPKPAVIVRTNSTTTKIVQPSQTNLPRPMNPQVSYYSSDEIYNLDSEIAEDLKMYLGYNPSSD